MRDDVIVGDLREADAADSWQAVAKQRTIEQALNEEDASQFGPLLYSKQS